MPPEGRWLYDLVKRLRGDRRTACLNDIAAWCAEGKRARPLGWERPGQKGY